MASVTTRGALTFLLACLGARLAIAAAAFYVSPGWLRVMGMAALVLVCSWVYIYMFDAAPFGRESGGLDSGLQKIWWNNLRPLHAGLYFAFAVMAIKKSPYAYRVILLDTLVGLVAWLHHYS